MDTAARQNDGADDGVDADDAGVRPPEEAEAGGAPDPERRPGSVPAGRRWWHWWR